MAIGHCALLLLSSVILATNGELKQDGEYPYYLDCTGNKFVRALDSSEPSCQKWLHCSASGVGTSYTCPPGTLFDIKETVCNWPWNSARCPLTPDCGAGNFHNTDNTACEACPLGTWLAVAGLNGVDPYRVCIRCPPGTSTRTTGSSSLGQCDIDDCRQGWYYNTDPLANPGGCTPCPLGTWSDRSGVSSDDSTTVCTACPADHTTDFTGANRQALCRPITTVAP